MTTEARPTTGRLQIVPDSTTAAFEVGNLFSRARGTIPVRTAEITVDAAGRPVQIVAELDLSGIDTGIARRDRDLRGRRFFDTAQHPTMTFTSTSITSDLSGWSVTGTLHVGDRDAPVTLAVTRSDQAPDRFIATGSLDRRDAGITAPPFLIRRIVHIQLEASLSQA